MTFLLDAGFDAEFYTGVPPTPPNVPFVYQVSIGGHPYIIDLAQYSRITTPLQRQAQDQSVEPGEQSLNTVGVWRRAMDNWFYGAGQFFLDNRFSFYTVYLNSGEAPSVRTRYWRSKGVNPWNEGALSLLPEVGLIRASTNTNLFMQQCDGYMYVVDGTELYWTNTPSYPTTTWTASGIQTWAASAVSVNNIASNGTEIYAALGTNGIGVTNAGATTSSPLRPVVPAPSVSLVGTGNAVAHTYWVVATDALGNKSLPTNSTTFINCPTAPNGSNYLEITWPAVGGAVSYDILKDATTSALALGVTATSLVDSGQASSAYVPPTTNTFVVQADHVWFANGFLLASRGPNLYQIFSDGFSYLIYTHYNPNFTWDAATSNPSAILIAGHAGSFSAVYSVQLNTTTGYLNVPVVVTPLPEGEYVMAIRYYLGIVILGTSRGLRIGTQPDANGMFSVGGLITYYPPDELYGPAMVRSLAVDGRFVYFSWENYNTSDGVLTSDIVTTGLGRMDPSAFPRPEFAAYATDVMGPSGVNGAVDGIAFLNDQPMFSIAASGVYYPTGNLVESGDLETGWIRYGTVENKVLVSIDYNFDPLAGSVGCNVISQLGDSMAIATISEQGAVNVGDGESLGVGLQLGERFMLDFVLGRSTTDATKGPILRRWTSKAIVVPQPRQDEIIVPLMLYPEVDSLEGDGNPLAFDPLAEYNYLKQLQVTGTIVSYTEGTLTCQAFIDQIEVKPEKWQGDREWFEGTVLVKLITVT